MRTQNLDELRQLGCTVLLPTFLAGLLVIFRRSHEEERANIPQILDEAYAVFHHAHHFLHIFRSGMYAMGFHDRHEQRSNLFVVLHLDILMVEPFRFLIIKFRPALAAMAQVEGFDQFFHAHHLLVVARVPAQQSQEIDNGFRQIAAFTVS